MTAPARVPAATRLVAGIDEAGLGPLLGPLTLGFSVLRLPRGGLNVWDELATVVSRVARDDAKRLVVADSKKVHARNPRGRRRLETTVLGFLAQRPGGAPTDGAALLRCAAESFRPRASVVARHPWYAELPAHLPLWVDAGRLELRAEALRRELEQRNIELVDAGVRLIPAGELNRSFRRTHNKGVTVWTRVASILKHIWMRYGAENPHVIVDRQGGRFRYARPLKAAVPEAQLVVGHESPNHSEYQLDSPDGTRSMRVTFAEKAEDRAFTVALASCIAKYTRELAMDAFNNYFLALQPGLLPTAGYTTDGRRWVRDAEATLHASGIDPELLIRQR
jgi:hypothetical protein